MFHGFLQGPRIPPGGAPSSLLGRLLALASWLLLALVGLGFLALLLVWLLLMTVYSLVRGLITGQPSTVGTLWRQYRDLSRRRWPGAAPFEPEAPVQPPGAAPDRGAAADEVEDVRWRDVD